MWWWRNSRGVAVEVRDLSSTHGDGQVWLTLSGSLQPVTIATKELQTRHYNCFKKYCRSC